RVRGVPPESLNIVIELGGSPEAIKGVVELTSVCHNLARLGIVQGKAPWRSAGRCSSPHLNRTLSIWSIRRGGKIRSRLVDYLRPNSPTSKKLRQLPRKQEEAEA
ncbi:MAG: hypothetical protein IPO57_13220, partial [Rhodocyclales bacterium]|nr:hypothetical protein [Rhodocyclales bacterium]